MKGDTRLLFSNPISLLVLVGDLIPRPRPHEPPISPLSEGQEEILAIRVIRDSDNKDKRRLPHTFLKTNMLVRLDIFARIHSTARPLYLDPLNKAIPFQSEECRQLAL